MLGTGGATVTGHGPVDHLGCALAMASCEPPARPPEEVMA
jgi:hypothetical protein